MAHTNLYTTTEWNLRHQMQQETEAWLRSVRDGNAWRGLPNESNPQFFAVGARASMAVQAAIRRAITGYYFTSLESYLDPRAALPVLVYSVSPIFSGRPRTEFSYDIHSAKTLRSATNGIDAVMSMTLGSIEARLMEAGELNIASYYAANRARRVIYMVRTKQPKALLALLRGDEIVVGATIQLLAVAGDLRDAAKHRDSDLRAAAEAYCKAVHRRLRNFYCGLDLTPLGPDLFSETINAVKAAISSGAKPLPEPRRSSSTLDWAA